MQPFEELIAWQKARVLARKVYELTRQEGLKSDFGLSRQMQRCAVSIMSNIAEGYERGTDGAYLRFLSIAKASCAEIRSQIYLAYDIGYLEQSQFTLILEQAQEVGRILGGLRAYIRKRREAKG